jgi:hypothetical protein
MEEFEPFESYDLTAIAPEFDVAIVDGPITSKHGEATRYIPLEWCFARLKASGVVFLDDADRAEEQRVVDFITRQRSGLTADRLRTEKGLLRFAVE